MNKKQEEIFVAEIQNWVNDYCSEKNGVRIDPNAAKVGGLQSQGVKVEIVVGYIDPLTTQDLKSSGFPVG